MPRDLAQLGRDYGDLIVSVFERLCSDDGKTIAIEDQKAFERWHANKAGAVERELRAEGATEHDIGVWRGAWRDQIAPRTNQTKATTF
jgi:hypothetical protein